MLPTYIIYLSDLYFIDLTAGFINVIGNVSMWTGRCSNLPHSICFFSNVFIVKNSIFPLPKLFNESPSRVLLLHHILGSVYTVIVICKTANCHRIFSSLTDYFILTIDHKSPLLTMAYPFSTLLTKSYSFGSRIVPSLSMSPHLESFDIGAY